MVRKRHGAFARGTQERIRCRASYDPSSSGQSMKLELNCESDAWNFDLSGQRRSKRELDFRHLFESVNRVGGRITGSTMAA